MGALVGVGGEVDGVDGFEVFVAVEVVAGSVAGVGDAAEVGEVVHYELRGGGL